MYKYDPFLGQWVANYQWQAVQQQAREQSLRNYNEYLKEVKKQKEEENFKLGINLTEEQRILRNKMIQNSQNEEETKQSSFQNEWSRQDDKWFQQWVKSQDRGHFTQQENRKEFQKYKQQHEKYCEELKKKQQERDQKAMERSYKMCTNAGWECWYTCCAIL